ncbi:MAG TPA: hypothetical protein VF601_00585 [Beijerinckiaceae bacterium]|jgi:hypothetical protein
MVKRYSGPGAALASASLALATLFLLATGDAGLAAPAKGKAARPAPVEQAAPAGEAAPDRQGEPKAAFTVLEGKPGEPAAAGPAAKDGEESCLKARRKLWVDGEGWIVRRVTTCR